MTIKKKFLTKCETKSEAETAIALFQRKFDKACIYRCIYDKNGQKKYYKIYELLPEEQEDRSKSK